MPLPAGIKNFPILFALTLLTAIAPCPADAEEFAAGRRYVVETDDGAAFTSEIAESDGDSLYFVDGTAMARSEVAVVRRPGEWAQQGTLHPGPETQPAGSTLEAGNSAFATVIEAFVSLLIAVLE